jgi:UDP-glucuronate 4-epimerase
MKILITGDQGFIGGYLKKELDSGDYGPIAYKGYDLKKGDDIRDRLKLDKLMEAGQFDAVIHLAALAGVRRSEDFPDEYISTNINGTKYLINACKKWGVENFIFYSSSSVLGGGVNLKESDSYNPKGVYAITKVAGELLVASSGLNYAVVRPFTVYGENGRSDMVIYKWINQIKAGREITFFGQGDTTRGYTYVKDVVGATAELARKFGSGDMAGKGEVFHIGGCEEVSLARLLEIFKETAERKGTEVKVKQMPIPDGDVTSSLADTSKAKNFLDYNPRPGFYDIVRQILEKEL